MSQREIAVHPNSTAARKWKRKTWRTSRNLFVLAAEARAAGDHERAQSITRAAQRGRLTEYRCG